MTSSSIQSGTSSDGSRVLPFKKSLLMACSPSTPTPIFCRSRTPLRRDRRRTHSAQQSRDKLCWYGKMRIFAPHAGTDDAQKCASGTELSGTDRGSTEIRHEMNSQRNLIAAVASGHVGHAGRSGREVFRLPMPDYQFHCINLPFALRFRRVRRLRRLLHRHRTIVIHRLPRPSDEL